jgi:hypothetical protein
VNEPTNFDRAKRAYYALESYREAGGLEQDDIETSLGDLLCDIRHLCRTERWNFFDLDARALRHFAYEVDEEEEAEEEADEGAGRSPSAPEGAPELAPTCGGEEAA